MPRFSKIAGTVKRKNSENSLHPGARDRALYANANIVLWRFREAEALKKSADWFSLILTSALITGADVLGSSYEVLVDAPT